MQARCTLRRAASWAVILTLAAAPATAPAAVVELSSVLTNPWRGLSSFDLVPFGDELINSVPFVNEGVIFTHTAPLTNRPAGQFTNSVGPPGLPPVLGYPFQRGFISVESRLTNQGQWLNSSGSKMVVGVGDANGPQIWNDGGTFVNSGASIDSFGGLIRNIAFVENCAGGPPGCGSANRDATFVNGNGSRIYSRSIELEGGQIAKGQISNINPTNLTAFPVFSRLENSGIGSFINNESGSTLTNSGAGAIVLNLDGAVIYANHASLIPNISPGAIVNEKGAEFINRRGSVNLSSGGSFTNSVAATFNNAAGGVIIESNSTFRNLDSASFISTGGAVFIRGSLDNLGLSTFLNTGGAGLVSEGAISNLGSGTLLTNQAGSSIRVSGAIVNAAGAKLTSTGAGTQFSLRDGLLLNSGAGTILLNADGATFNGFNGSRISNAQGATIRNEGAGFDLYASSQFTNASGASLINTAGGVMTNGGNFTNTQRGSLFSNEPDGAFGNYDGSFSNVGGATLRNSGGFYNGAFFTSSSLLVNSGADSLLLNESGALLVNSGAGSRLLNESGALLANQGLIRNSAEFVVRTEARVDGNGTYLQTAGVTTANGFIVQGTFDCQGGTVNGAGHISAPNLSIGKGCSVDPGNSPGTLTLDGGAAGVEFDGILNIEIAGLFDHDVLRVLSGGIHFDAASLRFLFEGYEPAVGDGFDFLDGAFDGTFSFSYEGLREGYQFELARNALGHLGLRTLAVPGGGGGSVPLPGTVVLALLGLGALRLLPTGRARSLQRSCAGA